MDWDGRFPLYHDLHPRLTLQEVEEIEAQDALRRRLGIQPSDTELAMTLLAGEIRMERDLELANRLARGQEIDDSDDEDDMPALAPRWGQNPIRSTANVGGGRRPPDPPVQRLANIAARPQVVPPPQPARPNTNQAPAAPSPTADSTSSMWWPFSWFGGGTEDSTPARLTGHNCAVCQDPIRGFEYRAPCGDYYDKECLIELFTLATQDESLYPPRCCRQHIPVDKVLPLMSPDAARKFRDKATEFGTLKRVYCAVPTCSRFLGPEHDGGWLSPTYYPCPACPNSTCAKCKNKHEGLFHSCKSSKDEREVLDLGQQNGWASCPGCNQLIELNMGCYHMTCRCRTEFCYLCKKLWKTCPCVQWDENRLLFAAEQRVDAQFGRPARPAPVPIRAAPVPPRPAPAPPRPAPAPVRVAPAPLRLAVGAPPLQEPIHEWLNSTRRAEIHRAAQVPDVQRRPLATTPVPVARPVVVPRAAPRVPATPPINAPNPQWRTSTNPFAWASDSSNTRPGTTAEWNPLDRSLTYFGTIPSNGLNHTGRVDQPTEETFNRYGFAAPEPRQSTSTSGNSGRNQIGRHSQRVEDVTDRFMALSTSETPASQNRTSSYTQHKFTTMANNSAASTGRRSSTDDTADIQAPARNTQTYTPIKFVSVTETATTTTTRYTPATRSSSIPNQPDTSTTTTTSSSRRSGLSSTPFVVSNASAGPSTITSRRNQAETQATGYTTTSTGRSSRTTETQDNATSLRQKRIREAMEQLRVDHDCQHQKWKWRGGADQCQSCHRNLPLYLFVSAFLFVLFFDSLPWFFCDLYHNRVDGSGIRSHHLEV
ncbi:hypothetical protein BDN72DRAFT_898331 [Pluteus cervinus]|uniref:Uncharacterized protein n=1 Tax=Pluteus cervinus TaxID=181527 RepID=A0ACD3AQJ4_9AGAR|nr:hypothetical protein BDN72DRAFT_898331 [Pluteus cervinus]